MKPILKLLLAALAPFGALAAPAHPKLDAAAIRAFAVAQNRAWNARDLDRFYALFDPRAQIVSIRKTPEGTTHRSVRSIAADRARAERFFACTHAIIRETDRIEKIEIAPDGRHARVRVREETGMVQNGRPRMLHATTVQQLEWRNGRILSLGLTEFEEP